MSAAVQPAPAGTRCYQRRRPQHTLWYRTVQTHFETWLALAAGSDATAPPVYVEPAFRRHLECGILANGFARAFCKECGRDFLVAFSCQGRAVCPSCNNRRMVETAAHLSDHVLPPLLLRQWVLAVPKRRRYFRHDDAALQGVVVRILLRAIERCLRKQSPDFNTRNPSPRLCRCACAMGRSGVIFAATPNGCIWPQAGENRAQICSSSTAAVPFTPACRRSNGR